MPRDLSGMNVKGKFPRLFSENKETEWRTKDNVYCEDYIIGYDEYPIDYLEIYEDILDEYENPK